ncbi:putative baseplate protein/tail-associated lysozyme [Dickeya phage vB_DsoM_JA33]|uniref:Putative baseplate protein/tail-associated lysozyme n=3 Tax=Salmondvirus JA11 TaxID=2734141 RepID=A0A386K5F3_9CAUD|nr:putative baseplate protein/tail-associated lysozyme [Dickeya phage vB_DsoM_JA11]AXG67485.1 putative baseplate protein/tail-associated lysozyme [Dickeya phage vB_DsoM_JA33]AYD79916.1 putative baseplate protein/tail-associated lysozyme [Dickeya phage vB_DsoM_JA11]
MMNLNGHVQKKGIDPNMDYEAVVVDTNDPKRIGQVRARIVGIFDNIEDKDLPWLRPKMRQVEGWKGGSDVHAFGTFNVPQRNSKISVKFPTGDMYTGEYTMEARPTEADMLPEALVNYPHRMVHRLSSATQMIVDRMTKECILIHGGDFHFVIYGDVNQTIIGNQQLTVTDSKSDVPKYISEDPVLIARSLQSDQKKRVAFKGAAKGSAGNQYTLIKGNQTVEIHGNRKTTVKGSDTLKVSGDVKHEAAGYKVNANRIDLN